VSEPHAQSIRAVLDTNVLLRGLTRATGPSRQILEALIGVWSVMERSLTTPIKELAFSDHKIALVYALDASGQVLLEHLEERRLFGLPPRIDRAC
jgi:predicted nucleic acid-binding protein